MARYYKVWVSIEEINEENDHYEDLAGPDPLGEFDRLEDAASFVRGLPGWEPCNLSAAHIDNVNDYLNAIAGDNFCSDCGTAFPSEAKFCEVCK